MSYAVVLYSVAYMASVVFSFLWIEKLSHQISVYLILFSSTLLAILVFNVLNISSCVKIHKLIFSDFKQWAIISFSVAICWCLSFVAASENAFLFIAIFFLTNALSAAVYYRHFGKSIAIALVIAALCFLVPGHLMTNLYSILSGICGFIYLLNSVNFSKKNQLSATELLAIRFYPLLFLSVMMCLGLKSSLTVSWTGGDISILLALAFFNQILPNFLSQSAAHKLQLKQFSFIISFIPFMAFVGNGIMYDEWNIILCVLSLIATLALNFDMLFKRR